MEESERIEKKKSDRSKFIEELNQCALRLQKNSNDEEAFEIIHSALHRYIVGQAFHRFIIKGHDGKDLYQESLIVLWQKAIPSFNPERGMSFWNFAKMCITRHLITILNSAMHRKKDLPMNTSVSLDEVFGEEDDSDGCSLYNMFDDGTDFIKTICKSQDHKTTLITLKETLSSFESLVLHYYLEEMSYREISEQVSCTLGRRCNEKSIDNALLRIRRKACDLLGEREKERELPLFSD